MDVKRTVQQVLELYPKVFFACHVRHVTDPKTQEKLSSHQASILDHLDDVQPWVAVCKRGWYEERYSV